MLPLGLQPSQYSREQIVKDFKTHKGCHSAAVRLAGARGSVLLTSSTMGGDWPPDRNHIVMGGAGAFYQSICSANSESTGTLEMCAGAPDAPALEQKHSKCD